MSVARYLDAAATAPLREEALERMREVAAAGPGNPSSVHGPGHRAAGTVAEAREQIAGTFGVRPPEVIFTSGGTEANNLAIIGLALANPRGRHLVTTPIEHPSVLESCRFLERVHGFELTLVPVGEDGRVTPAQPAAVLRPDTTLVSIGLANAEVGTVQDLPALAREVRASGALLHTDAVQAAASLPVSLSAGAWPGADIDAMTVASHKFGGPQGVGALIVRQHLPVEPLLHGGGQERGMRSGTENVVGIAGFAAAVVAARAAVGQQAVALMESRDALVSRVLAEVPGARLTGHAEERLPGHASFVVRGVSGESLLVALDAAGFAVSSGSACAAGNDEPSPALLAMGIDPELAQTAVRFTLHGALGGVAGSDINRILTVLTAEQAAFSPRRSFAGAAHTGVEAAQAAPHDQPARH
ncbi:MULTISPECIES: cysteine desulfurase family protein [unclassified Leucobacter]|uniref:cysteine desulfurase family protein n=1 Tax=unclassified Leucobacter TaxID=2621730 RepID=UPI00165EB953|nr:cysteine desulfurase [Leucobacter sp. cx-87]